jgi:hypothetical protein
VKGEVAVSARGQRSKDKGGVEERGSRFPFAIKGKREIGQCQRIFSG